MAKIDQLICNAKSKNFYQLGKKKGLNVNFAGLMFTEEASVSGWINRTEKDIKVKMPKTFEELELWNNGHTDKCFHNLDIEVINAETKALHHSAHLFFYEKPDVTKEHSPLEMGKLAGCSTQKKP